MVLVENKEPVFGHRLGTISGPFWVKFENSFPIVQLDRFGIELGSAEACLTSERGTTNNP